ncbi:MAG TPA: MBL fold metallo-hydrolase [Actinomycetota bacterium]|jgi:glyoxylase-like metal-dependent hydrolase (beta-lactamase superfamily II)
MSVERTVGTVRVIALLDGVRDIGPIEESYPGAPVDGLLAYRDRYPELYGDGDSWRLHIHVWLIEHPGGVILFDTGVGPPTAPAFAWFGEGGRLASELSAAGFEPGDVDVVVVSHVHDDHIGGTATSGGDPAFPSARYLLQRADWDWQRELARESEEDRTIWETLLAPLERAGVVDLVDGDHRLAPGVEARHSPGHTPGHQVVLVSSDDARVLITADSFNHPAQLAHPDWSAASDADPEAAAGRRRWILADLAEHAGTIVAPTHFAESFGTIEAGADGLPGWTPLGR